MPKIKLSRDAKGVKVKVKTRTDKEIAQQVDDNQARRAKFLTDEQKTWKIHDWIEFVETYALVPSDTMEKDERNQVNYGRVFIREWREKTSQRKPAEDFADINNDKPLPTLEAQVAEMVKNKQGSSNRTLTPGELADTREALKRQSIKEERQWAEANKIKSAYPETEEAQMVELWEKAEGKSIDEIIEEEVSGAMVEQPLIGEEPGDSEQKKGVKLKVGAQKPADEVVSDIIIQAQELDQKDIEEAAMFEANPIAKMWEIAEIQARKGNRQEWATLGFRMQAMIEYAFKCLQEEGQVIPPKNFEDIFDGGFGIVDVDPRTKERRDMMTERVKQFLKRKAESNPNPGYDPTSKSYRVRLARKDLHNAIERYAANWRFNDPQAPTFVDDEDLSKRVQKNSIALHEAYCPIPKETIKPGPIDNIDPDFLTYVQTCRNFKIEYGSKLHEVIL